MLTMAGTTCTRLWLDQTSQNSGMDWGGAHEVSPLSEELLTVDDYWESHFSSVIQTLRD